MPTVLKTAIRIASAAVLVTVSLGVGSPAGAAADPYPGTPQQIRDTGPCGPTGGYRASEWLQTTTDPTIQPEVDLAAVREAWYWRHDVNTLWRGDSRAPRRSSPPASSRGHGPHAAVAVDHRGRPAAERRAPEHHL